jgi:hypothetical protein
MRRTWKEQCRTLDDQRVFGPAIDYQCACGKYPNERYRSMICDVCGVKVAPRDVRRQRFGHIDLPVEILHPFNGVGGPVGVVPVLPAAFRECSAGAELNDAYEKLVEACRPGQTKERIEAAVNSLCNVLLPVATFAFEWDLADADILIQGMILFRPKEIDTLLDQLVAN